MSDVSYTPERAEKILYSAEAMGFEDYHVFIAPTNTEIRPDDFIGREEIEMNVFLSSFLEDM